MSWDIKKVLTMKENINEVYSIEIQNMSVHQITSPKKVKIQPGVGENICYP